MISADLGGVYTIPTSPGLKTLIFDQKSRKYQTNPEKYPKIHGFLGFLGGDLCGSLLPSYPLSYPWSLVAVLCCASLAVLCDTPVELSVELSCSAVVTVAGIRYTPN